MFNSTFKSTEEEMFWEQGVRISFKNGFSVRVCWDPEGALEAQITCTDRDGGMIPIISGFTHADVVWATAEQVAKFLAFVAGLGAGAEIDLIDLAKI